MRYRAIDTETFLIRPGWQAPPIVCLTWSDFSFDPDGRGGHVADPRICLAREAIDLLWDWLHEPDLCLFGANTPFDVLASTVTADVLYGPGSGERLLAAWAKAYDSDRVRDVLSDQKLIDIAAGAFNLEQLPGGRWVKHRYNLADVAKRNANLILNKLDPWRLRYGELAEVPIDRWPSEAIQYATHDAYATAASAVGQVTTSRWYRKACENFPGKDPLALAAENSRAGLALKALSAHGLRTEAAAVARFESYIKAEHSRLCVELELSGLVRFSWPRPANVTAADWRRLRKGRGPDGPWLEQYGAEPKAHRCTKAAQSLMYDHCQAEGLPVVRTDSFDPKKKGHGPRDCISLNRDTTKRSGNELLVSYSEVSSLAKVLSSDMKWLKLGTSEPIHSHFDECKETNRTGSSKPNVQNRDRGKKDKVTGQELAGDRECFTARDGTCFIDADFESGEMWTLAQVCHWWLGWTTLGDSLKRGINPHTKLGCDVAGGIPYEVAVALKKSKDPRFLDCYQVAKVINFSRPGGGGADTIREIASKQYGIDRPVEFWRGIIALFDAAWPELPEYFRVIRSSQSTPEAWRKAIIESEKLAAELAGEEYREPRLFNLALPTGFLRAGAPYTAICNHPYQHTLSVVIKRAMWKVFRACYVDRSDALYGCRPANTIHDQLLIEVPTPGGDLSQARAAAKSTERHMCQAAIEICPDYPTWTEAILCERWSKQAQKVTGPDGQLEIWRDTRLAA